MPGRLEGRSAVVTGGASGLGRAIALRFADEGAFVVVGDLREDPKEGGEPIAELLGDRGTSSPRTPRGPTTPTGSSGLPSTGSDAST